MGVAAGVKVAWEAEGVEDREGAEDWEAVVAKVAVWEVEVGAKAVWEEVAVVEEE